MRRDKKSFRRANPANNHPANDPGLRAGRAITVRIPEISRVRFRAVSRCSRCAYVPSLPVHDNCFTRIGRNYSNYLGHTSSRYRYTRDSMILERRRRPRIFLYKRDDAAEFHAGKLLLRRREQYVLASAGRRFLFGRRSLATTTCYR